MKTATEFVGGRRVRPVVLARAFHQPRIVVAGVQPPGARGIEQSQPPPARAAALSLDLRRQPRRVLHGARRRPGRPGAGGHDGNVRRRLRPGRAARAHRRARRRTRRFAAAALARAARRTRGRRHRHRRSGRALQPRSAMAGGLFPSPCLSRADAAGGRPGASLSLHSQSRLHPRARTEEPERPPHDERAGARSRQDRSFRPAAGGGRARAGNASFRSSRSSWRSSASFFPATRSPGRAVSGSSATATSKSRKRPKTWCAFTKAR